MAFFSFNFFGMMGGAAKGGSIKKDQRVFLFLIGFYCVFLMFRWIYFGGEGAMPGFGSFLGAAGAMPGFGCFLGAGGAGSIMGAGAGGRNDSGTERV
jgi:hypothetical protein